MIMNQSMKNLFISALLLALTLTAGAADTLKIHLTYKHKLDTSGHITGYTTINQKFYSPGGILFREINYDEKTSQLSGYIFYFYRNDKLFTQESYNQKDSLQTILKHEYDQAGNEILLTKLVPGFKNLIAVEKTVRTFDKDRKLLLEKKFFGGHLGLITQYQYSKSGALIREKNTCKAIAKAPYKKETRDYSYSSENRISEVLVTGTDLSGKPYKYSENYNYNEKGLLSSVKKVNISNSISGEKVYKYLPSGAVSIYEEHDAKGKLLLFLQYDYKKHYMEQGTQVSYYENL
jgi:hypothetical protein